MMESMNRRNLIACAGAGLVLSACSRGGGSNTTDVEPRPLKIKAECEDWGQLVGDTEPSVIKPGSKTFAARYVCCVYMKFEATGISVRHAYVPVSQGSSKEDWYKAGKALFIVMKSNSYENSGVI